MIDIAGVSFDPTITVGNLIEVVAIIGGGALALSKISTWITTKFAVFTLSLANLTTDVNDMKLDIKEVNKILAKAEESDRRIGRLEDFVFAAFRKPAA